MDFRNTVVIMTSNLGSAHIQELARSVTDPDPEIMREAVMEDVNAHFRPEFINRIDEVVVFDPLSKEQIRGIASIQLQRLRDRLLERDLKLELSEDLLDKLSEAGFDPVYGARPLKRAIQQLLENPLAEAVLSGQFQAGDTIHAGLDRQQKVVFDRS